MGTTTVGDSHFFLNFTLGFPLLRRRLIVQIATNEWMFSVTMLFLVVWLLVKSQHNSIVDGLHRHRFITKHNINCSKEAVNPLNDTRQRPGDLYIPVFDERGGNAFFDVSVINILAPSYIQRASRGQLESSKIRYDFKMTKYPDLGSRFKPLVVESTEGWHPSSMRSLKQIADLIAAHSRLSASTALNSLLTPASCRLQRHQGATLTRRALD